MWFRNKIIRIIYKQHRFCHQVDLYDPCFNLTVGDESTKSISVRLGFRLNLQFFFCSQVVFIINIFVLNIILCFVTPQLLSTKLVYSICKLKTSYNMLWNTHKEMRRNSGLFHIYGRAHKCGLWVGLKVCNDMRMFELKRLWTNEMLLCCLVGVTWKKGLAFWQNNIL